MDIVVIIRLLMLNDYFIDNNPDHHNLDQYLI